MSNTPPSVTITSPETGTTAEVLVGLGFNCYSFRPIVEGQEIEMLWSEPEFAEGNQRPSGSGIPLMFPFPGRLRGKNLMYDGKSYDLRSGEVAGNAIHGYVLDRPWRLLEQETSRVVAQFQASVDSPDRLACWPSDYSLTATYTVAGNTLLFDVTIENPTQDQMLPFGFGTHPYFRIPVGDGRADACKVCVPASCYWELVEMLPSGQRLDCNDAYDLSAGKAFEETQLDDVLTELAGDEERVLTLITDAESGRTMTMAFDDTFRECVVYNPPHREAICIEPLTCVPNAYELAGQGIETGLRVLEPGQKFTASVQIAVT
ncbi:MAG: aldose 1-epimerase [Pirellulales bacterium]|nr:aldose 1-epimerase [Pirellulales bacterium]